ncbi:MAG: hypothetical protein H6704_09125 [Myxococcales bacterium]|nr:hypothetical protein [Myxococcales bacterium]
MSARAGVGGLGRGADRLGQPGEGDAERAAAGTVISKAVASAIDQASARPPSGVVSATRRAST